MMIALFIRISDRARRPLPDGTMDPTGGLG